jgi:hypothetical protein
VVSRGVLAMGGGRWIDRPMLPMRNRRDNENQARSFTLLSLRSHQLRTFHHSHEFQYSMVQFFANYCGTSNGSRSSAPHSMTMRGERG